ncbi:MAG: cAMP regulatory protein, partial [Pseudomonadota bacterium]
PRSAASGEALVATPLERLVAAGARPVGPDGFDADELALRIRSAEPFSSLTDDEARTLIAFLNLAEVDAGVRFVSEGDPSDFVLLVVRGAVEVLRRNANGYPSRLAVAEAGTAIGEMSMFDAGPRFGSCDALEPTRIAVLTRAGLEQLMAAEPSLACRLLVGWAGLLSARLRESGARLFLQLEAARSA